MASRVGGALSPFLVIPIQKAWGWRASFYCFGILGVVWAVIWYRWYRDSPREKPCVTPAERNEIGDMEARARHGLPWGIALRSSNLWAIMLMYFTYCYGSFFFLSWLHTYLVRGRGYTEDALLLSTLPFVLGALANCCGGFASDLLVRRLGLKWGRRAIGIFGLTSAAAFTIAAMLTQAKIPALILLALSYAGSDFMLPTAWAVCLDVGKKNAGAVTGTMNTAGQIGSFISSVLFGYLVEYSHSYDFPLIPMTVMLAISALLWLKIDPTQELIPEELVAQRAA
jgi:sugar phosphate permease